MNLAGSTLVETLIAFTVLLVCVSMASMIIISVSRSSGKFDYLEGWITMQNLATETIHSQDFTNIKKVYSHFHIIRSVEPSSFTPSLCILELKVIDHDSRVKLRYKSIIMFDRDRQP
jgi:hypothetical protein